MPIVDIPVDVFCSWSPRTLSLFLRRGICRVVTKHEGIGRIAEKLGGQWPAACCAMASAPFRGDIVTLAWRSLSEASHHNRILCLPAVYSVRSRSHLRSYPHSRCPTHSQHSLTRCTHVSSKTSRSPYHHSRGSNLSWITCRLTMRLISARSTSAPAALVSLALPLSHRRPVPRRFAEYSPSPLV